jgi:hypothetical protein
MEGALAGISPRLSTLLAINGIRSLEDIARLDPYDVRFKGWEEELLKLVNRARAAIADRVVREVSVAEAIVVKAAKELEPELIQKAIEARLGLFSPYVIVERRALDGLYEFRIMRNVEQPLSYGPWMEYKLNARLYASYLRSRMPSRAEPGAEALKRLLEALRPPVQEEPVALGAELLKAVLLSDRLHLLIIERQGAFGEYAASLLEALGSPRLGLGAFKGGELAERLSAPGTVVLEGLSNMNPEEARVLRGLLRRGRAGIEVKGEEVEFELQGRVVALAREDEPLPSWLPSEFPAVLRMPGLSGSARLALAEAKFAPLPRPLVERELRLEPLPQELKERLASLLDLRPELGAKQALVFVLEAAKAKARERGSGEVGAQDYVKALELLERLSAPHRRVLRRRTRATAQGSAAR